MRGLRLLTAILLLASAGCVARSELLPPDLASGDSGGDGSPVADWRQVNAGQWQLVQEDLAAAAAQGTTGPATATLEGPDLGIDTKWSGGVLAPNGRIYAMPFNAQQVLELDPSQQPVSTRLVGPVFAAGGSKWSGCALGADGRLYGTPVNATSVLVIDPTSEPPTVSNLSSPLLASGGSFSVAVRVTDNLIVGLPYSALDLLLIDTATEPATISRFGDLSPWGSGGSENWGGGALAPNGKVYAVPYSGSFVLEIDPVLRTVGSVGPSLGGRWFGAILAGNGKIYGLPDGANTILEIDATTPTASVRTFGATIASSDGGSIAPSGRIFSCPWNGAAFLEINPDQSSVTTIPVAVQSPAFAGGVLAPNGRIYCVPAFSPQVLVIDPKAVGSLSMQTSLSAYVNVY